jgi:23S rRNA pseudouridine1911/1915/1917 synthase
MKWSGREIVYCDNHLLVALKRGGEVVQPQLQEEMRLWVQREFAKKGRAFLEPVHRLDKSVSGLVLFARTSKALQRLNAALRQRQVGKTYRARVEGSVKEDEGILHHFLVHDDFCAKVVSSGEPGAKEAILSYKVLERKKDESLLEIDLHTGRYHQIRAQFAATGHPIIGDRKYGSRYALEEIALEHVKLVFLHPVTGACLELTKHCRIILKSPSQLLDY